MINETIIASETLKATIFTPSIFLIWVTTLLVFVVMTYAFKSKNTNWGNFWNVLVFTILITGGLVWFMTSSPDSINSFFNQIKGFLRL